MNLVMLIDVDHIRFGQKTDTFLSLDSQRMTTNSNFLTGKIFLFPILFAAHVNSDRTAQQAGFLPLGPVRMQILLPLHTNTTIDDLGSNNSA